MFSARSGKKLLGAMVGLALCAIPTAGLAVTSHATEPPAIAPTAGLNALGSEASRAATCGASILVGATAAASSGMASQGCVLPVVDQAPPPSAPNALLQPPASPPAVAGELESFTSLLGLATSSVPSCSQSQCCATETAVTSEARREPYPGQRMEISSVTLSEWRSGYPRSPGRC